MSGVFGRTEKDDEVAEWLTYLPWVDRLDAFTIRCEVADVPALSRFLMFAPGARGIFGA
jgi:hypothetical protein